MSRIFTSLLFCFLLAVPSIGQTAEDLFQQAIRVERLSGNTEAAIALYQQIVDDHSSNRSVTARALLQIGKAYEILGRDEASNAYGRIIDEYSDFGEVAREARTGMARTSTGSPYAERVPFSTSTVNLYDDLEGYGSGLSPSGRYFAAVANHGDESIVQVDLLTGVRTTLVRGTPQLLEDGTVQSSFGQYLRYSPDETELAYRWREPDGNGLIKILNLETGDSQTVFSTGEYFSKEVDYETRFTFPYVVDWTQDGSSLLVFASANGVKRLGEETQYDMHLFILPLDGSDLRMITKTEELQYWMQSPACLAGDDRYVMMEYNDGKTRWIQRVDVRSGESVAWRKKEDATYLLVGCPSEADKVLYSADRFSIPYLWAGESREIGPDHSDEMLFSDGSDLYTVAYSDDASIVRGQNGPSIRNVVIDANPATSTLLEEQTVLAEGWSGSGAWDPSGNRFAWGDFEKINILDRSTGRVSTYEYDVVQARGVVKWFPDGSKIGLWRTNQKWFASFDLETGEQSTPIEIEGVRIKAIGADGKSLIVADRNSPRKCLERFDLATSKRSPFFCLEGESYEGIDLVEYHDYSKYLFSGWTDDGTTSEIGVVGSEGQNPRLVYERVHGDGAQGYFTWSSPSHIAMAEMSSGYFPPRRKRITSFSQLDTNTGELEPMYESIFSYMNLYYFQVSPDGRTAFFYGLPQQKSEPRTLEILHNVLGEVDKY